MYSSSLALGSSTSGPWPGAISAIRAAAQPLEPVQVGRERARGTGVMNTLPSPSTASPVNTSSPRRPGAAEREVVGSVAGGRERLERPDPRPVGQEHVDLAAGGRQRGVREPPADRRNRLGVIGVVVSQRDPAEAAARLDLGDSASRCSSSAGPGVDQPRRVAADDPRVGPGQRERPRVRRADPDDVVVG